MKRRRRVSAADMDAHTFQEVVLGFSFGLRMCHPGTCNMDLMRCFLQRKDMIRNPMMLQQELTQAAELLLDFPAAGKLAIVHVFESSTKYPPTTKDMAHEGVQIAREKGYNTIHILAFPFIHRFVCWYFTRKYAKPYGISVKVIKTGFIPFDEDSNQWLARGPVQFICYTLLRACGIRWL